jgi:hypothetical protein
METMENRLAQYSELRVEKRQGVICPVCKKPFVNKYCLSNHFLVRGYLNGPRYFDEAHKEYFLNQKLKDNKKHKEEVASRTYVKKCIRCGIMHQVDFEHRFQKRCPECEIKYPNKIKKSTGLTKNGNCARCNAPMIIKVCSNNQICEDCRTKEKEEETRLLISMPLKRKCSRCGSEIIYYRKHKRDRTGRILCGQCKADSFPFKKDPKYEKVIFLLEKTTLTRREIKNLLGLEKDFVREAALEKYGLEWYSDRVSFIRDRAGPVHGATSRLFFAELKKDKNKLEEFFKNRFPTPSKLELDFQRSLAQLKIPFESNKWTTIKVNGLYERREVDIKVPLEESKRKFAIFIDGEAFHGDQAYFKMTPVDKEAEITRAFSSIGYLTIRYSESEIKMGTALNHFLNKYREFKEKPPSYYCRNWMINEEIIQ